MYHAGHNFFFFEVAYLIVGLTQFMQISGIERIRTLEDFLFDYAGPYEAQYDDHSHRIKGPKFREKWLL